MEFTTKNSDMIEGVEVLFFSEAEVKKSKGFANVFATSGPLTVLYFKEYSRYVLKVNDWKYPLLRRIPIVPSEKHSLASASYVLPTLHGFTFTLTIEGVAGSQALVNFETILHENSNFSAHSQFEAFRKVELSPDDKLSRLVQTKPSTKEVISEAVDDTVEIVKDVAHTIKADVKNMTSGKTSKRINLKELKTKNFKRSAVPSLNKEVLESSGKSHREFSKVRMENPFLTEKLADTESINKSSLPTASMNRGDLEEAILKNKDLAVLGNFFQPIVAPKMTKGLGDIIGEAMQDMKDMIVKPFHTELNTSVTNSRVGQGPMEAHARLPTRVPKTPIMLIDTPSMGTDSMTHYQG